MRKLVCLVEISSVFLLLIFPLKQALSWSNSDNTLVEDFSDVSHWDAGSSTGLWNIIDHAGQSGRVTSGVSTQTLSFGDGSDGTLSSSTGYVFDTDKHPNGFNFVAVNITGGIIEVKGSQPLIVRSLSTVNIVPTLSVQGGNGSNGVANGSTTVPTGGTAVASQCAGGSGGSATGSSGGTGGVGLTYNGSLDNSPSSPAGSGGTGGTAGSNAVGANDAPSAPASPWETAPNFRCGAGGSGGGGHVNGANYATGGSGGAGGGTVRIIAAGAITYTQINANGGNGGLGANDGQCSGGGAGGNGGAIWLQSLKTVSGTTLVTDGGQNGTCSGFIGSGLGGVTRIDTSTQSDAGTFATGNVAPQQTYVLQSLSYDLGIRNAGFTAQPTVLSTLNGGSITVTYQGSTDGTVYTSGTTDITSLTNQNIRYIKFKITIQTASTAGPSPQVTSISLPYSELDIRLSGGCGMLRHKSESSNDAKLRGIKSSVTELAVSSAWLCCFIFIWALMRGSYRFVRTRNGPELTLFPAGSTPPKV